MTETTTIRIPVETKDRLNAHKDGDQSIGDVVTWLAATMPIRTEITRKRDSLAAYFRTHLVRDFGDQNELAPGERMWEQLTTLQHPHNPGSSPGAPDAPLPAAAAILDHTALTELGIGRRSLAQLVYAIPGHHERHLFAPTQAIYTATIQRPGVARHLERLGVIDSCDFDMAATLIVGDQVASNSTPAVAHVVYAAKPSTAWPTGRPVITLVPEMYQPYGLKLLPIPKQA